MFFIISKSYINNMYALFGHNYNGVADMRFCMNIKTQKYISNLFQSLCFTKMCNSKCASALLVLVGIWDWKGGGEIKGSLIAVVQITYTYT